MRALPKILDSLGLLPLAFTARSFASMASPRTLLRNLPYWRRGVADGLPIPSPRARFLVTGSADIRWYLESGLLAKGDIEEALRRHRTEIGGFEAILDFGCGCGRVLRHWKSLDGVRIHGAERNPLLVGEARRTLPFADVILNSVDPPLPYADGTFDFVYALSVLTHLDDEGNRGWRDEMRRILKPGGLWLFTTHGESYLHKLEGEDRKRFVSGGLVCLRSSHRGENLCVSFHPTRYVREVLAEGFSLAEHLPEASRGNPHQDIYLLRRDAPVAAPGEERP